MKSTLLLAYLLVAFVPLAHATTVRADKLPPPKNMACLQVKQPIAYSLTRGLLHIPYDIQLGRGAYVSEREDANGVYYRAPEGAITERRTDVKEDSRAGRSITFDGGMYVPNDPAIAPTLYKYYATDSVVTQSVPDNTDCSMLAYAVDPNTHKVSVVATAIATGFGAAAGVVSGRFIHPHVHTSYGQAAGAGLAGGLIAGRDYRGDRKQQSRRNPAWSGVGQPDKRKNQNAGGKQGARCRAGARRRSEHGGHRTCATRAGRVHCAGPGDAG